MPPLTGYTVALCLTGPARPSACALRTAGARVTVAPPNRPAALDRLASMINSRSVDAVAFGGPAAVRALLGGAGPDRGTIAALTASVLVISLGATTGTELRGYGVPVLGDRLDPLELAGALSSRAPTLTVGGRELTVRGHAVLVDGRPHAVPPAPMAVLRALAGQPGRVLSRAALLRRLPGPAATAANRSGGHAVEVAVARLRVALGDPAVVQTVVKRGYRLPVE